MTFENPANKPSKFTQASIFYPGFVLLQARETCSFWSLEFASIMDVTADCKPGESLVFRGVSGTTTLAEKEGIGIDFEIKMTWDV